MSAFFVSQETIDDCVSVWFETLNPESKDRDLMSALGRGLWSMNLSALVQRYSSIAENAEELLEYVQDIAKYKYVEPSPADIPALGISAGQKAKSVNCLLYQCSEGDVPDADPLFARLSGLSEALGELFGCDAATWDRYVDAKLKGA